MIKLLQAPVADGFEGGFRREGQEEHPRYIPHLAGYHHRVLRRIQAAEVHIGQIHIELKIYPLSGGVDDSDAVELVKETFAAGAAFQGDMPGKSPIECGNYINLAHLVKTRLVL